MEADESEGRNADRGEYLKGRESCSHQGLFIFAAVIIFR